MKILHRRHSQFRARLAYPVMLLGVLACGVACGSDNDDGAKVGGGAATGGGSSASGGTDGSATGGSGAATSATGGAGNTIDPNNNACGLATAPPGSGSGMTDFDGCTGVSMEAEAVAADIFILLDQSTSMGDHRVVSSDPDSPTRWEAMTDALKQFINAPETANLRVGLQYFPLLGEGSTTECNAEAYATPELPITPVTAEHRDALIASLDAHFPSGLTPAIPALGGALAYAKQWADDNPGRPTVVVWAADGFPTECGDTSITSLEDLAEEYGNGTPRVSTFVVGLGPVANLKRVADAGGTEAFFVSDCPTAVDDLLAALKRASSSPTLCEFELPEPPEGDFLDYDKVNMTFSPNNGGQEIVRRVESADNCGSGGWYYDDPEEPTLIHVCPSTCGRFGGGTIDIVVGCTSVSLQ